MRLVASLPVIVPVFLALLASVSTLLMISRSFHGPLAGLIALVLTVVVMRRIGLGESRLTRQALVLDLLAILLAVGFAGFNARFSAQNLIISRDPGTYAVTSQWLVNHSSTDVDTQFRLFGDSPQIQSSSSGIGRRPELGHVYPQGSHGLPAVLSVAGSLFGSRVMYAFNCVLGGLALLAVYGFGRQVVGRFGALVGAGLLGTTLPQIYFSRDTYTEPLSQLLVFGGLALLLSARRGRPLDWGIAGLVLAGGCLVRIDAFLVLSAGLLSAGLWLALARRGQRRTTGIDTAALLVGGAVPAVLGYLDLKHFAAGYLHTLEDQFHLIMKLTVVSTVGAVVLVAVAWATPLLARLADLRPVMRARLGLAAGGLLVLGMVVLALRPLFMTSHGIVGPGQMALITRLQREEGRTVDAGRSYAESTISWMTWYLGTLAVVLGVLGLAVLVARSVRRGDPMLVPFFLVLGITGLNYLVNPSITPDQLWAIRRYVPTVLPGLALASMVVVVPLLARLASRSRPAAVVAGAAVVGVLIGPVVQGDRPLLQVREGEGQLNEIRAVCEVLPDDAAVLVLGSLASRLPMTVRTFCDVPAVWTTSPTASSAADLGAMARRLATTGHQLYVVGGGDIVGAVVSVAPASPLVSLSVRVWETTLTRPPRKARTVNRSTFVGKVDQQGEVTQWLTRS